jgi:hypothetical protein
MLGDKRMGKAVTRIPFDEFSNNVEDVFDRVLRDNSIVEIERQTGEIVVLQPVQVEANRSKGRTAADHEAFLSSFGGWGDVDVDTFLNNIYESRRMLPRPPVEV